jgi:hypothetical protein
MDQMNPDVADALTSEQWVEFFSTIAHNLEE